MKSQIDDESGCRLEVAAEAKSGSSVKLSLWRKLAAGGIVAAGFCWVVFLFANSLTDKDVAGRDYIQYWAAGYQVLHHADPYDPEAILRLEQSAGPGRVDAEISPSPPIVLLFATPFALFSPRDGLVFWFAFQLACISASLWILWLLHGRPNTLLYLFGFLFAPVFACLQCGQISLLFLLSILASLYFLESRPWIAGALLVPLTLKPHLFLPFAVALLLWIFVRRTYGILAGFALGLAACLAIVSYLDPHVWIQYQQRISTAHVLDFFVPTLSEALQRLISEKMVWLRFVPDLAACLWAAWYFRKRRHQWNWMDHGMLMLLVSYICAPYAFFYDESVLLPAVLTGALRARQSGRSLWPIAIAAAAAFIECLYFVRITSLFYLWTVPAWLLWYLYATKDGRRDLAKESPLLAGDSHRIISVHAQAGDGLQGRR